MGRLDDRGSDDAVTSRRSSSRVFTRLLHVSLCTTRNELSVYVLPVKEMSSGDAPEVYGERAEIPNTPLALSCVRDGARLPLFLGQIPDESVKTFADRVFAEGGVCDDVPAGAICLLAVTDQPGYGSHVGFIFGRDTDRVLGVAAGTSELTTRGDVVLTSHIAGEWQRMCDLGSISRLAPRNAEVRVGKS